MNGDSKYKQPSPLKELLKTSLPAVIDLSFQPILWAYEAAWIGRLGASSLGGHGLAINIIIVVFTVLLTFVVGSSIIINRHLGRGSSWDANHILGQSMMLGIFMSIFIAVAFYYGSPQLFRIIKETAEPAAQEAGIQYLQTLSYFMPLIVINFIALGIIRGVGDTHFSMLINLVISGIYLILAPLFIFGWSVFPKLGVTGAALTMGIAHSIGLVATIILLRSRKCKLFLSFRELTTPNWESIKLLFNKGLPTTVEQLSWTLGMLIVSFWVARISVIALATHQILLRLQAVMSMIYQGFGLGSMSLIGKKIGADEHSIAERAGKQASRIVLLLVMCIFATLIVYSDLLLRLFTNDQRVIDYGTFVILIFALVQIPKALNTVLTGNLRGAGDLKFLMWNTLVAVLVFEICASAGVIFIFHLSLNAVWIVHGFDESTRFLFNFFRFRNGKWKTQTA